MSRFEMPQRQGATSELQYLERLNTVANRGQLNQARVERLRQPSAQSQQIQQLKAELEELARLTEASVNLVIKPCALLLMESCSISSPEASYKGTETVMKIVPYDTLQAKVEIPSAQIGL